MPESAHSLEPFARASTIPIEVDDERLLERARRGDEAAFSELFARYRGPLYRYAVHMGGPGTGDDVVQETFLALLRGNGRYDASRGPLAGYLFGIARHAVLRDLASRGETTVENGDDPPGGALETTDTALDGLTREETIEEVRAAIRSLPPVYREVVVLCELEDMDYADAAVVVGCPIGTIRSRLHRARALLVTKLSARRPVAAGHGG